MATTHRYQDESAVDITDVPGVQMLSASVEHRYQREGVVGITGVPVAGIDAPVTHQYQREGTISITGIPGVYTVDASVAHQYQREGTIGITDLGSSQATVEAISTTITVTGAPTVAKIAGGTGGSGRPKVRVGGLWLGKPAKVYLNGAWVEKPMKRHNGTAWVPLT